MSKKVALNILFLISLLCFNPQAWALVAGPDFFGLDFRFNNPGARAIGMGGAFIGVADDATAAYTNPAGLTVLTEPEISVEYKIADNTAIIYDQVGRAEFEETVHGASFISFAYPIKRFTVTVYRHQLLNTKSNFEWREGGGQTERIDRELDAATYGIGLGLKLAEALSLGMSVGFTHLDFDLSSESIDPTSPAPRNVDSITTVDDNDLAEHFTFALLLNPFKEFNIGFVYRQGPKFKTRKLSYDWDAGTGAYVLDYNLDNNLKIPDVFGLGISNRFFGSLTAAFDVNYITYSDLVDNLLWDDGYGITGFEIDDEIELHAGLEYIFDIKEVPFAVRGGYYYRPDNIVHYEGPDPDFRRLLPERDDDDHIFSLGLGAVLFENLQIDVAGSMGDFVTEGILSLVYRF
jgi:long-chain fatty acid transport protein